MLTGLKGDDIRGDVRKIWPRNEDNTTFSPQENLRNTNEHQNKTSISRILTSISNYTVQLYGLSQYGLDITPVSLLKKKSKSCDIFFYGELFTVEHKREKVLIQSTSFSCYSLQQVIFFDWGDFGYLNAIINVFICYRYYRKL